MHASRTPAQLLAGAAVVAVLTGCTAVDGPPPASVPAPVPATDPVRPAQDVEPQIALRGPAREALEAALPSRAPTTAPPRGETRRATGDAAPPRAAAPEPSSSPALAAPSSAPSAPAPPSPAAPGEPELERAAEQLREAPPVTRTDVCALGERYGGWDPASVQAGLCRGVRAR
ncbi:hypothetical protein GCM10010363_27710 [Streptomyces omiyaensis]|uniref:hypothetical protein n=1 Tax=Streptomyces omiyaensis TaxID=68247 RepID=UPI00199D2EBD|nr:hypothetical protein [Streptomyces omiyaensis]GGY45537.1 hypothetical protein GCM10010363_27710 [Streptomyces omiyaensis]